MPQIPLMVVLINGCFGLTDIIGALPPIKNQISCFELSVF